MRKNTLSLIFIFVFLFSECATLVAAEEKLKSAPDFKLQDLYKNEYSLSSYKNKQPVVLFFFTTWCPYCRKELASLNDRYLELSRSGFELFAIDIGESPEKVDKLAKNYSLAFKILLDKDTSVAQAYEILGVPIYILVDKKGRIVSTDYYFPEGKYKELISK